MAEKRHTQRPRDTRTLAVDIGGSAVKAMVLDEKGRALTERHRIETPRPATPTAVLRVIEQLARTLAPFDRVSVGFPGVVRQGVTETAPNLNGAWKDFPLAATLAKSLKRPVRAANDADVQGLGAIEGHGVELVLTLGTGMGSALFVDGRLVPNLEMPHHVFRQGETYEDQLGNAALKKVGKKHWNKRLRKALQSLEHLFNYDAVYLGGGNAKKLSGKLPHHAKIVSNLAGLYGGIALWRQDGTGKKRGRESFLKSP